MNCFFLLSDKNYRVCVAKDDNYLPNTLIISDYQKKDFRSSYQKFLKSNISQGIVF